jgi:hypothetical protein
VGLLAGLAEDLPKGGEPAGGEPAGREAEGEPEGEPEGIFPLSAAACAFTLSDSPLFGRDRALEGLGILARGLREFLVETPFWGEEEMWFESLFLTDCFCGPFELEARPPFANESFAREGIVR